MRTSHYSPTGSQIAERLATFSQQMADFARGEQLRALRDGRRLSQEDAAHEIGVSTKALRAWEKGGKIKWENAKAAAAFYQVDPESLVTRESPAAVPVLATQGQLDRIEERLGQVLDALGITPAGAAEAAEEAAQETERQRRASGQKPASKRKRQAGG